MKVSSQELHYSPKLLHKYSQSIHGREKISTKLLEKAQEYLLNAILNTRVNALYFVKDYFHDNEQFRDQFVEHIQNTMTIFPTTYRSPQIIEKTIQYPLYGPRSLATLLFQFNKELYEIKKSSFPQHIRTKKQKKEYSSIIIDLRHKFPQDSIIKEKLLIPLKNYTIPPHLKHKCFYNKQKQELQFHGKMTIREKNTLLQLNPKNQDYIERIHYLFTRSQKIHNRQYFYPSVFPRMLDTAGNIIYAQSLVRMQQMSPYESQYVHYTRDPLDIYNTELVGVNPIVMSALYLKSEEKATDIVLSEEDVQNFLRAKMKIFLLLPELQ